MEEAKVFNAKKIRGLIKAYVRCPYCDKVNSHGSDKTGKFSRQCDGAKCFKEYKVSF